jgi:hypothetical protein
MDYDEVIERAAKAIMSERDGHPWHGHATEYDKDLASAAARILIEYGARLMREAAAEALIGYIHPNPDRLPGCLFASAQVRALDPAAIARGENSA